MEKAQAEDYLHSLLNKNLRITTTDTRMFLGQFKCTDSDRNIILSQAFEYRLPPPPSPPKPQQSSSISPSSPTTSTSTSTKQPHTDKKVTQDLTSRYMGLVVVPGEYITKIEVEEFESQMRKGGMGISSGGGIDTREEGVAGLSHNAKEQEERVREREGEEDGSDDVV